MANKTGIDVSRANPGVDYNKLKQLGHTFVIPRDGAGHATCAFSHDYALDPEFLTHVKGARAAGIDIPGVYHWIDGNSVADGIACAQQAITNVKKAGLPKTTVIWCDLEYNDQRQIDTRGLNYDSMKKMALAFCNYILAEGYPTGIYTTPGYIYAIFGTDIFDEYDIWLAHWKVSEPGFKNIVYWQTGTAQIGNVTVDHDIYYGVHSAGTAIPKNKSKETKGEKKVSQYQIMTSDEFVETLKILARSVSDYKNYFPANLLLYSNKRWSADCHNLLKAIFNGRDINNKTEGSFAWPLTATGDCTEYGLLLQCSDIQWGNFKTLKKGEPRMLYMSGHAGAYLGEEFEEPGQGIVNCVECTPRWQDGIQFSYIDPQTGGRSWAKGYANCGYWEAHGLVSKWVVYNDETAKVVEESKTTIKPEANVVNHYSKSDLAVAIIRNVFGIGVQNRINNGKKLGYTETEIRDAQKLVNSVVKKANEEKAAAEEALTVITEAYDVVAGKYGDGAARKKALVDKYGEALYEKIRAKVEDLLAE